MPDPPDYHPQPLPTENIPIPDSLTPLMEEIARNNHEQWAQQRVRDGWTWGPRRDDDQKHHPNLVPYEDLREDEKEYDRIMARETIKVILASGYRILPPPEPGES